MQGWAEKKWVGQFFSVPHFLTCVHWKMILWVKQSVVYTKAVWCIVWKAKIRGPVGALGRYGVQGGAEKKWVGQLFFSPSFFDLCALENDIVGQTEYCLHKGSVVSCLESKDMRSSWSIGAVWCEGRG